jgi:phosphotransferase system enzyme I (PtsI)
MNYDNGVVSMVLAASVSEGVGISKAHLFKCRKAEPGMSRRIDSTAEARRIEDCISAVDKELGSICGALSGNVYNPAAGVMDKYMAAIKNPRLVADIKDMIMHEGISAEQAVSRIMDTFRRNLEGLDNEYLSGRVEDIDEIKYRLLDKLAVRCQDEYRSINSECIVVAEDLTAGDVISMNPYYVKGIVTIMGSPSSSSSVIARHMNIPAVTGLGYEGMSIREGDILIVDGSRGQVYINPDSRILRTYGS